MTNWKNVRKTPSLTQAVERLGRKLRTAIPGNYAYVFLVMNEHECLHLSNLPPADMLANLKLFLAREEAAQKAKIQ